MHDESRGAVQQDSLKLKGSLGNAAERIPGKRESDVYLADAVGLTARKK